MELWIRSQDKRDLVNVKEIHLDIALSNGEVGIKGYFENRLYKMLGYYKNEKRALEVLDEIEEHLDYLNIGNIDRVDDKGFRVSTIYQMPEV